MSQKPGSQLNFEASYAAFNIGGERVRDTEKRDCLAVYVSHYGMTCFKIELETCFLVDLDRHGLGFPWISILES